MHSRQHRYPIGLNDSPDSPEAARVIHRANATREVSQLHRSELHEIAATMLEMGFSPPRISRETGLAYKTIYRIRRLQRP